MKLTRLSPIALAIAVSSMALTCSDDEASTAAAGGASAVSSSASSSATGGAGGEDPAKWLDRPLREQVAALEAGIITSAGLTQAYLDRIAAIDAGDAGIRAVLSLDPGATSRATELDGLRGAGALLQGAPILVKDNIDTAGIATTAGSLAMVDNVPAADAPIVSSLALANGLVLGKTNLSEWANFRGYYAASGWSSLGGQTKNGFDPAYNPCGSSSGSGAAVAAGLASAAIGTETDGSITCPAAVNGIVGFKPTVGLVSRTGIIPISATQDTAGPMTRTVGDAARLMTVLSGVDPLDPATLAIPPGLDLDFDGALEGATLQGKRLGVFDFQVGSAVDALFAGERARLEAAGATVIDITIDQGSFFPDEYTVLLFEFKDGINRYLAGHPGSPPTLADLIAFNDANSAAVMPFFGQEIFIEAEATTDLSDPAYIAAKQAAFQAAGTDGIDAVLVENDLDALIAPTLRVAWETDYEDGDPPGYSASSLPAVAGYPHLTVPMGLVNGLPAGMSFIGTAWSDREILALGHAYESLDP